MVHSGRHAHTHTHTHTRTAPITALLSLGRNQTFMVSVVTDLISQAPCTARQALDYFASAGFVVPIIILLLCVTLPPSYLHPPTFTLLPSPSYLHPPTLPPSHLHPPHVNTSSSSSCRLVIYGQFVVMASRNARFQLIKKQLILASCTASGAQVSIQLILIRAVVSFIVFRA